MMNVIYVASQVSCNLVKMTSEHIFALYQESKTKLTENQNTGLEIESLKQLLNKSGHPFAEAKENVKFQSIFVSEDHFK